MIYTANRSDLLKRDINWTNVWGAINGFPGMSLSPQDVRIIASWKGYFTFPQWLSKTIVVVSFAVGFFANALILAYFFKSGKYRIPIFTLFTSLALLDLLTCAGTCLMAQYVYPEVIFPIAPKQMSLLVNYITMVAYAASVCHLVFLAALRFYQLCYPLRAKFSVSAMRVMKVCLLIWVVNSLVHILRPFNRDVRKIVYGDRILHLFIFTGNSEVKNLLASIFVQTIPLIIIAVLHLLKLYKTTRNRVITKQGQERSARSKVAAMIIIVFVLSLVVRLGHSFSHGALGIPYQSFHKVLAISAARLVYSYSIIDPFLYFLCSAEIRRDMLQTMCKCSNIK